MWCWVTPLVNPFVDEFAANDGEPDMRPKPKAETATSAIRLSVDFVDICFLSLVDPEDFSRSAW